MKLLPITPTENPQGSGEAPRIQRRFGRLLSEPLVHFVVAGVLLFGAYQVLNDDPQAVVDSRRIEVTPDDVRQLAVSWLAQGRSLPTPDQLRSLVDQKVTEEILFREALALGLDRDDQIIKRRLAQKMDFLAADLAAMQEPTRAELAEWFSKNAHRFALPPHANFRHLYFSPDKRDDGARAAAADALLQLAGKASDSTEVASMADPFMFRSYYGDATPEQVAKEFGPQFAEALFALEPGTWHGPVQSGYGWHLLWIESVEPGRVPALEEVEPSVKSAWLDDRYRDVKQAALEEMRARYDVIVPSLGDIDLESLAALRTAASAPPEKLSQ